ncbi:MAG TPA: tetratricopeptide repeat protein [Thermobifida alba]|nr:tetratricopeptide repeat protein [Thermobifida alba]
MQRRTLGPEHPHTLASRNNLASVLQALGRLDEAEEVRGDNDNAPGSSD